jgi:hypothetical protein
MSDEALRVMLAKAVDQLRGATDLTMREIIGLSALPTSARTPEVCYSLGVLEGAAAALRATRSEMLDDLDLLLAGPKPDTQPVTTAADRTS